MKRFLMMLVIGAALLIASSAEAHEIGATRVTAHLVDGRRYAIDIITDASALLDKLDTLAGLPTTQPAANVDPAVLASRLMRHDALFRQRIALAFDQSAVHPSIAYAVAAAKDALSPPVATISLTGDVPRGARTLTWKYSWTFSSYALSMSDGETSVGSTVWLEGDETSAPFSLTAPVPAATRAAIAWRYLTLGFTHIVPHGLDHMLFVLGIFLLSRRIGGVLAQVTAFTVAHSVTLGLSMYGLIAVPPAIVEPLIAISIAYVAIENLLAREVTSRRIALVFAFGLLHGMGFAGALKELGLPRAQFLTALLTFNIGVEAGQLAVIASAFALVGWYCREQTWYRQRVVVPASLAIACVALYWTAERIAF